jgi:hypothetical protein
MITVSGMQQQLADLEKARRVHGTRQEREPLTGAHQAAQAGEASARALDRDSVPSVSEQEWAALSGPERSRLEQAGICWDPDAGFMRDAESGTQVSVGEARALLDRHGARKAIAGLDAEPGPGTFREPGTISPEDFRRGYEHPGHAAPSPQSGPPCDFPVPQGQPAAEDFTRAYLQPGHAAASPAVRDSGMPQHAPSPLPQVHGTGPAAAGIAAHMARYSMTSPSLRGGQQTT